jgi:outer membrane protein TolC
MSKHYRWAAGLFILILAAAGWAQDNQRTMSLSLEDCIATTLKHNLGLAIQVLNPDYSRAGIKRAEEKFMPTFSLGYTRQSLTNVSYSFIDSSGGSVTTKTSNYTFSGTESLPFGGTLTLSATGYGTDSNQNYQTINPRYGTTLRFSFQQPLLRNFGYDISRYGILVARNSYSASEYQLKQTLLDTVFSVESAYWNLVYAIENLNVRKLSLQLAKDLLDQNQRSVEVGTMAPMEILSAQAEVATREADLIQAETQVKSAEDQLKVMMNMPEDEMKAIDTITPLDKPTVEEHRVELDEALATALQYRPDLMSSKLGIELQQLNLRYAKNQILPDLNLSAYYSGSGVSGTQIIYQDNNPILFPDPIGTIPGNFSGAIKDTLKFTYPSWSVGLTLNLPLSNFLSKANYIQTKINLQQAVMGLTNQQQQIFLEIRNDIRAVESNFKRIAAYKLARELAEQKLGAEQEKLRVGQSTNFMVLSYQRDLANARISELNSVVAYNVSLASLDHDLGSSLKNKNVTLSDYIKN